MAALTTKFPSRRTISRMSRAEVEDRLVAMSITLPPARRIRFYDDQLPAYQPESGLSESEWREQKEIERNVSLADTTKEHPAAREALYIEGLKRAVSREGLENLNRVIRLSLMHESTANGCALWTSWKLRTAPRPVKESAVLEFLSSSNKDGDK